MIAKFGMYLQYPFVRYALIVSVLVALCSALLGVTLVLRRFSFIGDGLSHVAFGAMSVATVMNLTNEMLLILPVTVISAILLLRRGKNAKIKGDAAIAMISVAALAFGYLLVNVFSASSNISGDVCSTLFGSTSILTLTVREVWLSVILSIAVVVIFVLCYNKIFAVTFDEDFSRAAGVRADQYNLLIAVITAVIIKCYDGGPVFYRSKRLGRGFREFSMLKFRSMRVNAPDLRNEDGGTYNAKDDPRVTRIGRKLRETSLDELPQLLNVLAGQMSIVGPRPGDVESKDSYQEDEMAKLQVRPGITGYTQAYYRNSLGVREKRLLDAWYASHVTFFLDLKILLRTVVAVLKMEDVYNSINSQDTEKQSSRLGQ